METRSDNLKKVPVGSKTTKLNEVTRIKRKVAAANLERQAAIVSRKKEIPQLTPLHRLKRFKVIRDRNLKNKGFKTSLENKITKMEDITMASTTAVEVKEKVTIKENIEEMVDTDKNGIEKLDVEDVNDLENGNSLENGHVEGSSTPQEDDPLSSRLKESKNKDIQPEKSDIDSQTELKSKNAETLHKPEPIQDSNIESNMETEETNKVYSESLLESDAVSSVSSQQANNTTPGPTDDEDEVEVIESKPDYESSKENKLDYIKKEEEEISGNSSYRSSKESAVSLSRAFSNSSAASSYKSSYSNMSRIYGRRPVRCFTRSRKRKIEEEAEHNCDYKRTNSPSQPSPRWRFIPSTMNFWTPRTTPFIFSSTTPIKSLNDSMTVNIDEDTIRNDLDDSDMFSDAADDFSHQPAKKFRWGCAIM